MKNQSQTSSLFSSHLQNSIHQNIYGKSLAITSTEAQLSTTIIENPEILKYQQERQISAQANSAPGGAGPESSTPKLNSVMNGESLEDIRKVGNAMSNQQHNVNMPTVWIKTNSLEQLEAVCISNIVNNSYQSYTQKCYMRNNFSRS